MTDDQRAKAGETDCGHHAGVGEPCRIYRRPIARSCTSVPIANVRY